LQVHRSPEPLCNPRLREAATTLAAMRGLVPSLNTLTLFSTTLTNNEVREKRKLPKNVRQKLQF
jgi:glutamine synthetase